MRFILLLLSVVVAGIETSYSQENDRFFHVSNIPPSGLLLNKDWKFNAGDNIDWAKPGFNDSNWYPINPSDELHYLPQVKDAGIGWFRLELEVDNLLKGRPIALVISTIGASQIFLDGNIICALVSAWLLKR